MEGTPWWRRLVARRRPGPGAAAPEAPEATRRLVVDAMNVVGSRPDGWWRDRAAAVRRLLERLQRLAAEDGASVTLVVDGRAQAALPEGEHDGVRVLYARRPGRNAADDRIVELVGDDPAPAEIEVVTSDRDLTRRVESLGARTSRPTALLERLDRLDGAR